VKSVKPVLFAGGTFAGAAVAGLLIGVVAAQRLGRPLLAPGGLMLGIVVGAYSAFRLLSKSMA
jgi:hypothetical protein